MKELKYIEKIKRDVALLSLPQSLSQIITMVGKDDFSVDDLAKVIMNDPALTSRLLRMANSSFYHQKSQIATVKQAVMLLGMMQVKCLALSASVFQADRIKNKLGIDVKEMFSHFLSVAIGCKMIAGALGQEKTEEVFVAGLLHDIGTVFFIHHFPEDYQAVIKQLDAHPNLIQAEQAILGINHAAIGRMLAEKWNFPPALCDAIGDHSQLPQKIDTVTPANIVQLSILINKPFMAGRSNNLERRLASINQMAVLMDLKRNIVDDIAVSLLSETIKAAEYMGIDIGDPIEVLGRANRELFDSYLMIEHLFRERQDLSQRILVEERRAAAMESKNMAIATLSHYLNNATMAISGRAQLIDMLRNKGDISDPKQKLDSIIEVIEKSVKKILAVLYELRDLTNLDEVEKYTESCAINIDDRIKERLRLMETQSMEVLTSESPPQTTR